MSSTRATFEPIKLLKLLSSNLRFITTSLLIGLLVGLYRYETSLPSYTARGSIYIAESNKSDELTNGSDFIYSTANTSTNSPSRIETFLVLAHNPLILNRMIESLNLDIQVTPKTYPLIGKYFQTNAQLTTNPAALQPPFFAKFFSRDYVWANEAPVIVSFKVPFHLIEHPFTLVFNDPQHYTLTYQGHLVCRSSLGIPCQNSTGSIALIVAAIGNFSHQVAFGLIKKDQKYLATTISTNLITSQELISKKPDGLNSGIIRISLSGANQIQLVNSVNTIMNQMKMLDYNYQASKITKVHNLLESALVAQQNILDRHMAEVIKFKNNHHISQVDTQVQLYLTQLTDLSGKLSQGRLTKLELLKEYTPNHPVVLNQEKLDAAVKQQYSQTAAALHQFTNDEIEFTRLNNKLQVDMDSIKLLRQKIQEIKTREINQSSGILILNKAVAGILPDSTSSPLLIIVGGIIGGIFSLVIILLTWSLKHIGDVEDFCQRQNLSFIGASGYLSRAKQAKINQISALKIAHIRPLAMSLLLSNSSKFALVSVKNRSGTSFVSFVLARFFAEFCGKTLLVTFDKPPRITHRTKSTNLELMRLSELSNLHEITRAIEQIDAAAYGHIFFDLGSVLQHPERLILLAQLNYFNILVANQSQFLSELAKFHATLNQRSIALNALILNYTKPYWIHDLYSKTYNWNTSYRDAGNQ